MAFLFEQQIFHFHIKIPIPLKIFSSIVIVILFGTQFTLNSSWSPFIDSNMGGLWCWSIFWSTFIILMFAFGGVKLPSQWSDRTLFQKCGSIRRSNWTSPWKKMCILLTGQEYTQCIKNGEKITQKKSVWGQFQVL